jgi:hypothetical protein
MGVSIKYPEGTTFRQQLTLTDKRTHLPVDLAGAALTFAVYEKTDPVVGTPTPYISLSIGSGIEVTDEPGGVIMITFDPSLTVDGAAGSNPPGHYVWELELVQGSDVYEAGSGKFTLVPRRLDD